MKLKLALTALVFLVMGIFIGRQFTTPQLPEAEQTTNSSIDTTRLQQLADSDLQDYYRLKTQEERYKKADEILGKILAIFLADLGMKVSKPADADVVIASQTPSPSETAFPKAQIVTASPVPKESPKPFAARKPLIEVRSSEDITEFLKESNPENFQSVLASATGFSNKNGTLQSLIGRFAGSSQVISRDKPEVWDIEMTLNGRLDKGRLKGRRTLKLKRDGRVFSDSSGNGPLDQEYLETSQDPDATLIAAGPNNVLQIYYVSATDQVVGLVMQKLGIAGGYKPIGSFELTRQP